LHPDRQLENIMTAAGWLVVHTLINARIHFPKENNAGALIFITMIFNKIEGSRVCK
jgi:hypothetical protein